MFMKSWQVCSEFPKLLYNIFLTQRSYYFPDLDLITTQTASGAAGTNMSLDTTISKKYGDK